MNPSPSPTIGILGGGQLALMLAEAARKLSLTTVVYCQSQDEPAVRVANKHMLGASDDAESLLRFFEYVDLLIFENEFSPFALFENLYPREGFFFPSLKTMKALSDKAHQKEIFKSLDIATSDFRIFDETQSAQKWVEECFEIFGNDLVFKWGSQGYDGKGILVSPSADDQESIVNFVQYPARFGGRVYAERRVHFLCEAALIATLSRNGEFHVYPLVLSEQKNGICSLVRGPARGFGISEDIEECARTYADRLAKELGLCGTFALEFFYTPDQKLLVNEIAPRVHNSGHYSQDAGGASQFENHIRGVLGLPLKKFHIDGLFGMYNILGPEGVRRENAAELFPELTSNLMLHWYGKSRIVPRRKLGHANFLAGDDLEFQDRLMELRSGEEKWIAALQKSQKE